MFWSGPSRMTNFTFSSVSFAWYHKCRATFKSNHWWMEKDHFYWWWSEIASRQKHHNPKSWIHRHQIGYIVLGTFLPIWHFFYKRGWADFSKASNSMPWVRKILLLYQNRERLRQSIGQGFTQFSNTTAGISWGCNVSSSLI